MACNVDAVLFDMGGVLVRLDPLDRVLGPTRLAPDELWPRWLTGTAVRSFESGGTTVEEFADDLIAELELEGTAGDLIERFMRFPQGLFPGAAELVESVPPGIVTGVLSNTNALHWEHQVDAPVLQTLFDREYLSYRLGMVKPDRAIFDHVVADLGLAPERILFIDDNRINVYGARAAGLQAERAEGPDAAAAVLRAHHITS